MLIFFQSAILAAATIGSFSWGAIADAYWLASAFWYSSLILSILGLLLAAQQVSVLQLLGKPPTLVGEGYAEKEGVRRFLPLILTEVRPRQSRIDSTSSFDSVGEWRPRWKMVFIWQCPFMFLSYSVCFFLAGLTLFVCTPLIRGDKWNTGSNVSFLFIFHAVFFTDGDAGGGGLFSDCSLGWGDLHVCVVLDLPLRGPRSRVARCRGARDGRGDAQGI